MAVGRTISEIEVLWGTGREENYLQIYLSFAIHSLRVLRFSEAMALTRNWNWYAASGAGRTRASSNKQQ